VPGTSIVGGRRAHLAGGGTGVARRVLPCPAAGWCPEVDGAWSWWVLRGGHPIGCSAMTGRCWTA